MGLKINRRRDESFKDNRNILSATGKRIVVCGIIVVFLLAVILIISLVSGSQKKKYKEAIVSAVDRGVTVCLNSVAELQGSESAGSDLKDKIDEYVKNIDKQKKISVKAELTKEMITYMLGYSQDNIAVQDDLKGAQNRIMNSVKEYLAKYGSKSF